MRMLPFVVSLGLAIHGTPAASGVELVMSEGAVLKATTRTGTIEITAGKGLKRSYTWDGETRTAELEPREERWYGSLGAYYPGPGEHWKDNHGITRGVLQEGQQHFKTLAEALQWIAKQAESYPVVYRDDGLMVAFGKQPGRKQLNVEVWQIYIAGKKPAELKGSENEKIGMVGTPPPAKKP